MTALNELHKRFDSGELILSPIEHLVIISLDATDKERNDSLDELASLHTKIVKLRAENKVLREKLLAAEHNLSIWESE